jgi:hypothetical protein
VAEGVKVAASVGGWIGVNVGNSPPLSPPASFVSSAAGIVCGEASVASTREPVAWTVLTTLGLLSRVSGTTVSSTRGILQARPAPSSKIAINPNHLKPARLFDMLSSLSPKHYSTPGLPC